MITILFGFGGDKVLVTIQGTQVWFSSTEFGAVKAPIDGLRLNYNGVCKEFPDLETEPNWNGIAISRFKEKMDNFNNEEERTNYIIEDLKKFGYIPEQKQRAGFRPVRLDGNV